ncbi:MAG TPA: NADH-ubiquinone oxidoreductase-F iron-sulfur binding region domain-containing protein, partial [Anaerolineales bacterium]|nr:NADH-ubiquinone oxidoreductase-F iron-sulfur binding region domain-containing protein [Anaerolineales bacterium]
MGTRRQMEILDRVAEGRTEKGDFIRLQDIGWTMTDASLCGLGQTSASAILSAMKLWPEIFKDETGGNKEKAMKISKPKARAGKKAATTKPAKKAAIKKTMKKAVKPKAKKTATKPPTTRKPAKKR